MALDTRQRESIDRVVDEYTRGADKDPPPDVFPYMWEWLFRCTVNYGYDADQIQYLLQRAFHAYGVAVQAAALKMGREAERVENPSLRAFGAAVARASAVTAERDRALACEVFEKLIETGANGSYAFYQAIDAIGGRPPKT